jgi:hypothetical protein
MKNYRELVEGNELSDQEIEKIVKDINWIKGMNKHELIKNYPSNLDIEHLKSEPASILRNEIFQSKYTKKTIEKYMKYRKTPEGKKRKLPNVF